jgi:hypothetical protein
MRVLPLLIVLFLLPNAVAEFGQEGPNGFPINVDGVEVLPFAPSWAPEPVNKIGDTTLFPFYPLLTAEMQRLASEHPDLVRLHVAGTSRLGLDIYMLEIADFDNPNRTRLEDREVVYIDGGTHSNEYSGVYFVTEWAQFLLDEYATNDTAQWIVENRRTFILPMTNPDGSHAFGRLNALGVNINRNFPATWGTTEETPPMNNPGFYPNSEPETQTITQLFQDLQPDYAASIHCCGNLWFFPYGAEHLGDPQDFEMLNETCNIVFPDVRSSCGPIWSTIYPAGGSTVDEAYEQAGSAAWGFEMSGRGAPGVWGAPFTQGSVREQETESWRAIMHAFLNVERYGANLELIALAGSDSKMTATIHNTGLGALTQGTLSVGGSTIVLPDLPAGAMIDVDFAGNFKEDAIYAESTWNKRLHPMSPTKTKEWTLPLENQEGTLVAAIETAQAKPSMSDLLVNESAAQPAVIDLRERDQENTPMGLLPALGALALAITFSRRKK